MNYSNTAISPLTIEDSLNNRATEIWYNLTPTEKATKVMANVKNFKSIALRFRACINYIKENIEKF